MATCNDRVSIVIPAHNEGSVIGRCLQSMLAEARPGELEIIVVCNGCTDDTGQLARSFGDDVAVLETEIPSKSNALNLGDGAASAFPRLFIDADIIISTQSIREVATELRSGVTHGASARMEVDLTDRPWTVRAFYDVWMRLPYVNDNMLGCGVYAISEEGRSRFEEFPPIIADDCFIRLLFTGGERKAVPSATFRMTPPKTLRSLIHINVRRLVGEKEMQELYGEVTEVERKRQRLVLLKQFLNPTLWLPLGVYLYAKAMTIATYKWKERRGHHKEWNRDQTSRSEGA